MLYGRVHDQDAVESHAQLLRVADFNVEVQEIGLHLHPHYKFIGASPYRIMAVNSDDGLLEVKCPLSQKGRTAEEAATQKQTSAVNLLQPKCESSVTNRSITSCMYIIILLYYIIKL